MFTIYTEIMVCRVCTCLEVEHEIRISKNGFDNFCPKPTFHKYDHFDQMSVRPFDIPNIISWLTF